MIDLDTKLEQSQSVLSGKALAAAPREIDKSMLAWTRRLISASLPAVRAVTDLPPRLASWTPDFVKLTSFVEYRLNCWYPTRGKFPQLTLKFVRVLIRQVKRNHQSARKQRIHSTV
jgi:hypothetical protein